MHQFYLTEIKRFEGFASQATWDYAQYTNGFGTRALYPGEVISPAEAEKRFNTEIELASRIVDKHAGHLDQGTRAALTSLTFNAGTQWITSGLGDAVRAGDLDEMRRLFTQYVHAGGEVLPGLVSRRSSEVQWIGQTAPSQGQTVSHLNGPIASRPAVSSSPSQDMMGAKRWEASSRSLIPSSMAVELNPLKTAQIESRIESFWGGLKLLEAEASTHWYEDVESETKSQRLA